MKKILGPTLAVLLATATPALAGGNTFVAPLTTVNMCGLNAPMSAPCGESMPIDLHGIASFVLTVKARNFAPGDSSPTVLYLQDTANYTPALCFGVTCPTLVIPSSYPPASGAMGVYTSQRIFIPVAQRRENVALRVIHEGGSLWGPAGGPPVLQIQFFSTPQ